MKILQFLAVAFFFTAGAVAGDAPEWTRKNPGEDAEYFYFVGFGEGQSLSNARKLADEDARLKVVQQFSGVYSEFAQSSKETISNFESTKLSELQSDLIQIRGLKEIDSFRSSERSSEQIYILYRLPTTEADSLKKKPSGRSSERYSLATISSVPPGAIVNVGGRNLGATPLKVFLPVGRIGLRISKDGYKTFEQSFHVERGKDFTVDYALTALNGLVMVRCLPADVDLSWNQAKFQAGATVEFPAGKFEMKASKAGMKTIIKRGALEAKSRREFCLSMEELPKKPAAPAEITPAGDLNALVKEAFQAAGKDRHAKALELADRIDAMAPWDPIGHLIRADVYFRVSNYSKAFKEQALFVSRTTDVETKKKQQATLCFMGGMYELHGNGELGLEFDLNKECSKALDESPMNPSGHLGMAMLFEKRREFQKARSSYITAGNLNRKFKPYKWVFCQRNAYRSEFLFGGC